MAYTKVDICNLAQEKLGAEHINSLDAPRSPAERSYALLYPIYRDTEIRKYNWHFARRKELLAYLGASGHPDYPYAYLQPTDFLRAVRERGDYWQVWGTFIFDIGNGDRYLHYLARVSEAAFDPNFVNVLACRLAVERSEKATQSNTKKADLRQDYKDAVLEAAQLNSFQEGPIDISADDSNFTWISERA